MKYLTFLFIAIVCSIAYGENEYLVHLIPHSHEDPGWRSTMEEYYTSV